MVFLKRCALEIWESSRYVLKQIVKSQAVLGGDGKDVLEAERVKLMRPDLRGVGLSILFTASVTGLPRCRSMPREVAISGGDLRSAVNQEYHLRGASSATRACLRISVGIISASLGMIPPVSINSNRRPRYEPRHGCGRA